jgi:hypothetical protein
MLEHIPSKKSIKLWKEELARLIRRHRNRPSLFLMTMNNEMKFYLHEAPDEVVIEKGRILEGGVRVARELLPHLPLVCDSAYFRRAAIRSGRYERIILAHGYDDGDMANMPYWQYEQLESRWLLDEALRNSLAASNPELADRDLSHWTYGDYHRFNEQKSTENLAAWFSAEQLAELDPAAVAGRKVNAYGAQALARRSLIPATFTTEHTNLEDIILFLAQGEG